MTSAGRVSSPCFCGRFTLDGATEPQSCGGPSCKPVRLHSCALPCEGCFRDEHAGHDVGWRHEDGSLFSATCHDCGDTFHREDDDANV